MRLIDAEALIQDAEPLLSFELLGKINGQQTIDAIPVVHGMWEQVGLYSSAILFTNGELMRSECCSVCGRYNERIARMVETNFCPHCGARMDGE